MIDFTTVVGVDDSHLEEWRCTWPTWQANRPELLAQPLLIVHDAKHSEAQWRRRLTFIEHPRKQFLAWDLPGVDQREKMLNGLVFAIRNVRTPWYLKLDVDVVAEPCMRWLDERWFHPNDLGQTPVFIASPWSYTKPAAWIPQLEAWAGSIAQLASCPPLKLPPNTSGKKLRHRRIISYCFYGSTKWTVEAAAMCGQDRLPVASQDTFLWFCAAKRREFSRRVRMDDYGWRHLPRRKLEAASRRALDQRFAMRPAEAEVATDTGKSTSKSAHPSMDALSGYGARAKSEPIPEGYNYRDCGIVYLLTGPAHAARLVTSVASLRKVWDGPITVYTTHPSSDEVGRLCASDRRLNVEHRTWKLFRTRKNASFLTKVALLPKAPYQRVVYLDCDTLVAGDIRPLFDELIKHPFCATQFAKWTTTKRVLRRRIAAWRNVKSTTLSSARRDELIAAALRPYPAINGGVFGVRRDAHFLREWLDLAVAGRRTFICDEIALQMLLPAQPHALLDCRFNCSPIYAGQTDDVRVWHFHGEKHFRNREGRALWLPAFEECCARNFGAVADWSSWFDESLESDIRSNVMVRTV